MFTWNRLTVLIAAVALIGIDLASKSLPAAEAAAAATTVSQEEQALTDRVNELFSRYSTSDQDVVLAMMDQRFVILGSDFNVEARSPAELKWLMSRDFSQWNTASFSDLRDLDLRIGSDLATAHFKFTFTAAQ